MINQELAKLFRKEDEASIDTLIHIKGLITDYLNNVDSEIIYRCSTCTSYDIKNNQACQYHSTEIYPLCEYVKETTAYTLLGMGEDDDDFYNIEDLSNDLIFDIHDAQYIRAYNKDTNDDFVDFDLKEHAITIYKRFIVET